MIDFAQVMTTSLTYGFAVRKMVKELVSTTFAIIIFFIFFSFTAQSQCGLKLEGCYFEGEQLRLSSFNQKNSHYWFSFTAISPLMVMEVENADGVSVIIGETLKDGCELNSMKKIEGVYSEVIKGYYRVITNKLVPGQHYTIAIASSEPNSRVYFQHMKHKMSLANNSMLKSKTSQLKNHRNNKKNRNISQTEIPGSANQLKTSNRLGKIKTQAPHRMASNKFSQASKSKAQPKPQVNPQELEGRIEKMKTRIIAYEVKPDRNPDDLRKMKAALATWEKQLQSLKQ